MNTDTDRIEYLANNVFHLLLPTHKIIDGSDRLREAIDIAIESTNSDKKRLDWLANKDNTIGNIMLPTKCVERNPDSLRSAIDDAMDL